MTNLSSANINKIQENKEKLSIELQKKISNFTKEIQKIEDLRTTNMVESNKRATELQKQIEQVTTERNAALNGLKTFQSKLTETINSKKINANTIKNLENNLKKLQGISNAERKKLEAEINILKLNKNAAIALVNQLQTNKNKLSENLQAKISTLATELSSSNNFTQTLATEISKLTSQKETVIAELNKATKTLAATRSNSNAKTKNLNNIKSQLTARENEIGKLKNVSEQLKVNLLAQVQEARKLIEKIISNKAKVNGRERNFAGLMNNFKRVMKSRINTATLQNINTLNLTKYTNIKPDVNAVINKRKVELYKSELAKRNTNLANLRAQLLKVQSSKGREGILTQINNEQESIKRATKVKEFRDKINANLEKNIPQPIKNQIQALKEELPSNIENLAKYESKYREIFGKPKKFIFFNKVPVNRRGIFTASNKIIPDIQTFQLGAMGNQFNKNLKDDFAIINKSFGENSVNVFFVGPSGSGKTTLFKQYTGFTNLTKLNGITVYKPNLIYSMKQGVLYFSDEVLENYNYTNFAREFIRPTPFNPQSSRAHMSIMSGEKNGEKNGEKRRVFDLAGKESPVAISELALGFNAFDGKYWQVDYTDIFGDKIKTKDQKANRDKTLKALGYTALSAKVGTFAADEDGKQTNPRKIYDYLQKYNITPLDQVIINFIYANFIVADVVNAENGFKIFKKILKTNPNAKLTEYSSLATNKSKIMDNEFISKYDSYKAQIVKDFGLSKPIPKDLEGGTTIARYIFEMLKRVFEGVYITRSLFSMKFLFDPSKKNISNNLTEFTIPGINEPNSRFGLKVKKAVGTEQPPGKGKKSLLEITQEQVKNPKAGNNFVVLPLSASEFAYKTSFYQDIINKKDFKNCLIGVISDFETLDSKIKQQKQSLEFFKKI